MEPGEPIDDPLDEAEENVRLRVPFFVELLTLYSLDIPNARSSLAASAEALSVIDIFFELILLCLPLSSL